MIRLIAFLVDPRRRRNIVKLLRMLGVFVAVVAVYTVVFHALMAREGQDYSWLTGVYWALTVMSTLGFGDITFHTDLGRAFSIVVLLSGTVFMLILLPFTFLQFFWTPWMDTQAAARRPRQLPPDTRGHVVLTQHDSLSMALIARLEQFHYSYVLVEPDAKDATSLADEGLDVLLGDLDDPDTYRRARADAAALVVLTRTDEVNALLASTVRGVSETTTIIGTADTPASVDILELAGCNHVLQLANMLGETLARRLTAGDAMAHAIGAFGQLLIAEATVRGTPLVGKTLAEANLRQEVGVTVLGAWQRGEFQPARPETAIAEHTVLVLAANAEHLARYNSRFSPYNQQVSPVIIIGAGRVGRSTARSLAARGVDYRIVEVNPEAVDDHERTIVGSAAELTVLKAAGIDAAPGVVLTTRDDDTNVYLAIYCRRLRPDIQIIARANVERNVQSLHRVGTDFVVAYPSMGAREITNLLERSSTLMIAEGLEVVRLPVPDQLVGKSIAESGIRPRTGCSVVATCHADQTNVNPDPTEKLVRGGEIILIATDEGERLFLKEFGDE